MPREKPVVDTIEMLVHPFFSLDEMLESAKRYKLNRNERFFVNQWLEIWGTKIKKMEHNPKSLLVLTESFFVPEELQEKFNDLRNFAEWTLGKNRVIMAAHHNVGVPSWGRQVLGEIYKKANGNFSLAKNIALKGWGEYSEENRCVPKAVENLSDRLREKNINAKPQIVHSLSIRSHEEGRQLRERSFARKRPKSPQVRRRK